jgi:hypothetical protein
VVNIYTVVSCIMIPCSLTSIYHHFIFHTTWCHYPDSHSLNIKLYHVSSTAVHCSLPTIPFHSVEKNVNSRVRVKRKTIQNINWSHNLNCFTHFVSSICLSSRQWKKQWKKQWKLFTLPSTSIYISEVGHLSPSTEPSHRARYEMILQYSYLCHADVFLNIDEI